MGTALFHHMLFEIIAVKCMHALVHKKCKLVKIQSPEPPTLNLQKRKKLEPAIKVFKHKLSYTHKRLKLYTFIW